MVAADAFAASRSDMAGRYLNLSFIFLRVRLVHVLHFRLCVEHITQYSKAR